MVIKFGFFGEELCEQVVQLANYCVLYKARKAFGCINEQATSLHKPGCPVEI